jgi:Signal transduction histidine kinase
MTYRHQAGTPAALPIVTGRPGSSTSCCAGCCRPYPAPPLQRITATARRLSLSNLDERIGLDGPPDELKELADTFDAMVERLRASADSQRRFVANAAHELRTPLATQRALIQIGLEDPTPERVAQTRADLLEVNRRTERLINGLLILAAAEHGLDDVEPVTLDRVVEQAVGEASPNGVTVTVRRVPVLVRGDPVLLHRLVANLVDNALRYNRPDGTVHIELTTTGPSGSATLTVRNTGPVVPAERLDELFRPFSRLPHGRDRRDGAGLGLSIVAAIARAHHAGLGAVANPDGGLTVTVRFPAG